jgi:hypothetical protein
VQKVLGHMSIRTTEIYLHELGVDRGTAAIFESITHKITHDDDSKNENVNAVLQ